MRTGHTSPGAYEIRVQGHLEPRWATWFHGFELASGPDGTTIISGTVIDQTALHGLLQSLRDLGLPLVSVTQPHDDAGRARISDPHIGLAEPPPATPAQEESR